MARETVSVQLPTIRTVIGSVDLYQGHKASGDYSQNPGHENYHLHKRHPGLAPSKGIAQQQTDCLIFLLENLGFTINRQKSPTDPSQEIELLGLIADSIQMELQLPGSKIKNIRSDAKTLLQASQPTAREVSRLLGNLTHATHAMRAAPSSSGIFSHAFMPPCNRCRTTLNGGCQVSHFSQKRTVERG